MTITIDITPEVKAALARQAAAQGREVESYAASLLEQAVHPAAAPPPPRLRRRPLRTWLNSSRRCAALIWILSATGIPAGISTCEGLSG
jgi:anti-sigma factor RsiW